MSPFRGSAEFTQDWRHFDLDVTDGVATVTLNRPDKLNALTFDAYADLRDLLHELPHRLGEIRPPLGALTVVYCHHGVRSLTAAALRPTG